MTALTVVCGALVGLVALIIIERRRPHPDIVVLAHALDRALASVDQLCDRIQAPGLGALRAQDVDPDFNPVSVAPDDDDDFWESRDALADRMAREEIASD